MFRIELKDSSSDQSERTIKRPKRRLQKTEQSSQQQDDTNSEQENYQQTINSKDQFQPLGESLKSVADTQSVKDFVGQSISISLDVEENSDVKSQAPAISKPLIPQSSVFEAPASQLSVHQEQIHQIPFDQPQNELFLEAKTIILDIVNKAVVTHANDQIRCDIIALEQKLQSMSPELLQEILELESEFNSSFKTVFETIKSFVRARTSTHFPQQVVEVKAQIKNLSLAFEHSAQTDEWTKAWYDEICTSYERQTGLLWSDLNSDGKNTELGKRIVFKSQPSLNTRIERVSLVQSFRQAISLKTMGLALIVLLVFVKGIPAFGFKEVASQYLPTEFRVCLEFLKTIWEKYAPKCIQSLVGVSTRSKHIVSVIGGIASSVKEDMSLDTQIDYITSHPVFSQPVDWSTYAKTTEENLRHLVDEPSSATNTSSNMDIYHHMQEVNGTKGNELGGFREMIDTAIGKFPKMKNLDHLPPQLRPFFDERYKTLADISRAVRELCSGVKDGQFTQLCAVLQRSDLSEISFAVDQIQQVAMNTDLTSAQTVEQIINVFDGIDRKPYDLDSLSADTETFNQLEERLRAKEARELEDPILKRQCVEKSLFQKMIETHHKQCIGPGAALGDYFANYTKNISLSKTLRESGLGPDQTKRALSRLKAGILGIKELLRKSNVPSDIYFSQFAKERGTFEASLLFKIWSSFKSEYLE